MKINECIGIDEVGRGPVAGPVCICALRLKEGSSFYSSEKSAIKDSKKLSAKKREEMFLLLQEEKKAGFVEYVVISSSAEMIDTHGISACILASIEEALEKLGAYENETILLDGLLKAPQKFVNQTTLVKGDETEISIALASIVAKVTRDKYMKNEAQRYPWFKFEKNVGYGTKEHLEAVQKHGLTDLHRKSFLRKYI